MPTWLGVPGVPSWELCQAMLHVLLREGEESAWLSRAAAGELAALREGYAGLLEPGIAPLKATPEGVQ